MARILVIEDEHEVRGLIREMLERAGHEVIEASDGEEGVQRYAATTVDLVITDLLMPKKGGLSAIRDMRGGGPEVPIIAISGGGPNGKMSFLAAARTYPRVTSLRKPFRQAELLGAVKQMLGDRAA